MALASTPLADQDLSSLAACCRRTKLGSLTKSTDFWIMPGFPIHLAAGLGAAASLACAANLPACGALLYSIATSQTTVAVAEAALLAAAGVAFPGSISGVVGATGSITRTATTVIDAVGKDVPAISTVKGFLNATKGCTSGCTLSGLTKAEQDIAYEIAIVGDSTGRLTENLFTQIAQRTGTTVLAGGKYGSNNGFDLVLQGANGEVTIILDAKQMTNGAFSLSSQAAGNSTQLSEAWVKNVLARLPDGSPAKDAVSRALQSNTLQTAVGGINKATGAVVVVPVKVPSKSLVSQVPQ